MWNELWETHRGRLIGVAGGLFLSLIYLWFGLWDMLIVAFIVFIGYTVGKNADERKTTVPWDELFQWLNDRWRLFK